MHAEPTVELSTTNTLVVLLLSNQSPLVKGQAQRRESPACQSSEFDIENDNTKIVDKKEPY